MQRILVDTSAWFMLSSTRTAMHSEAASLFRQLLEQRAGFVTTNLVLVELHRLALIKVNRHGARSAVQRVLSTPSVDLIHVDDADLIAGLSWIDRFSDQDFTLTDATSFAVMERLGIRHAFAYDRDFGIAGFEVIG